MQRVRLIQFLLRAPRSMVLKDHALQLALGLSRSRIKVILNIVSLALLDRLLSRVNDVLPKHCCVHQDLPAVIRFLDREINLTDWLIRVDPDLVRDVLLVRRDSQITELNRSAGCCLRYSRFATWRAFNL